MTIEMNKFDKDNNGNFGMKSEGFEEGPVAEKIEKQTAKIPSDVFLWAAGATMVVSAVVQMAQPKRKSIFDVPTRSAQVSLFVGQWAAPLLLLGVYNKIVKVMGRSDSAGPSAV